MAELIRLQCAIIFYQIISRPPAVLRVVVPVVVVHQSQRVVSILRREAEWIVRTEVNARCNGASGSTNRAIRRVFIMRRDAAAAGAFRRRIAMRLLARERVAAAERESRRQRQCDRPLSYPLFLILIIGIIMANSLPNQPPTVNSKF